MRGENNELDHEMSKFGISEPEEPVKDYCSSNGRVFLYV